MAGPQVIGGTTQAITGAAEFAAALRRMAPQIKREFDSQNRNIAKLVIARGQAKAVAVGKQQAAAARSMKASAAGGGVAIRLGAGVPFALGAEYGAKQYPQFLPWKGNQWTVEPGNVGYFMNPAIRDSVPDITRMYFESVQAAASASGLRLSPRAAGVLDIARVA